MVRRAETLLSLATSVCGVTIYAHGHLAEDVVASVGETKRASCASNLVDALAAGSKNPHEFRFRIPSFEFFLVCFVPMGAARNEFSSCFKYILVGRQFSTISRTTEKKRRTEGEGCFCSKPNSLRRWTHGART